MKHLSFAVIFTFALCQALGVDTDTVESFKTEPTYIRTYFTIDEITDNKDLIAPGYVFIDPVHGAPKIGIGGIQSGPQIREQDGTLVWYAGHYDTFGSNGKDSITGAPVRQRVQDFHVCDYLGSKGTHLCWSERPFKRERKKVVVDQWYELVKELSTGYAFYGGLETPNMHEFKMVDDGHHYLQPAWPTKLVDLREVGGSREGYIWDGCFQEISVFSGNATFEWCWLDHFPLWQTNIYPSIGPNMTGNITSKKVGKGTKDSGWDAWHVNSMDKNFEGDYLLSTRHNDQILKIAGNNNVHGVEPGTALWRMGGKGGDIEFESDDFVFTKQHTVRFVSTTAEETVFSILDNAWEGELAPSTEYSSGMIISVDNVTKKGRLLHRYSHPKGAIAPSQGGFQLLPNKNAFVSWGSLAQFSEFTEHGKLLFHASYADRTTDEEQSYSYSYRIWKSPWVGKPTWSPKLVAYTHTCSSRASPLKAWVSWNGATEVGSFVFSVSTDREGPWSAAGRAQRNGFETEAVLSPESLASANGEIAFPRYVFVQALDTAGRLLPYGEVVAETFVPQRHLRETVCDEDGCHVNGFEYSQRSSCGVICGRSLLQLVFVLIFLVIFLEILDDAYLRLCSIWINGMSSDTDAFSQYDYGHLPSFMVHESPTAEGGFANKFTDMPSHEVGMSPMPTSIEAIPMATTGHSRASSLSSRPGFERSKTPFS